MKPLERDRDLAEVILADAEVLKARMARFDMTRERFIDDHSEEGEIAYDAIMSPVFRISEDALHFSDDLMALLPDYPWANIRGFRNFVAHGYREVDRAIAWGVVVDDIPELARLLQGAAVQGYLASEE